MEKSRTVSYCVLLALVGMALVFVAPDSAAGRPERPSQSLTVLDIDGTPVKLSIEDLRALPQYAEPETVVIGSEVGFIGIYDYAGVRVVDVLDRAKVAQEASAYKKRNMYVVFQGTDGYQVVASWRELYGTPEGPRVLAALDKGGKPLAPSEGKIRLVFPGDKYCGRSVMCLDRIEIRVADGVVEKKKDE